MPRDREDKICTLQNTLITLDEQVFNMHNILK